MSRKNIHYSIILILLQIFLTENSINVLIKPLILLLPCRIPPWQVFELFKLVSCNKNGLLTTDVLVNRTIQALKN
jgi:hypothetical protein